MANGKRGGANTKYEGKALCPTCGGLYAILVPKNGDGSMLVMRKHSPCGANVLAGKPIKKWTLTVLKSIVKSAEKRGDPRLVINLPVDTWKQMVGVK